nr:Tx-773 [Heteropoda pingtungensis]
MIRMALLVLFAMLIFSDTAYCALARGFEDTSDGYCDLQDSGYGRIRVGESGYNDESCTEAACDEGGYDLVSCGAVSFKGEGCRLVYEGGHYPDCCPKVRCGNKT